MACAPQDGTSLIALLDTELCNFVHHKICGFACNAKMYSKEMAFRYCQVVAHALLAASHFDCQKGGIFNTADPVVCGLMKVRIALLWSAAQDHGIFQRHLIDSLRGDYDSIIGFTDCGVCPSMIYY